MLINKIKNYIKLNSNLLLFLFFFMIHFACGLYITFFNDSIIKQCDIIFDTDSVVRYIGFFIVQTNHYFIKVHPLQLILLQPYFLIVNTLVHSNKAALLIGQAICSAATVVLIKNILVTWTNNRKISLLMSIIYGFSFSTLIFTSVPEVYVFMAFVNGLLFFYLSIIKLKTSELTFTDYLVISILTVFAFGINPISIIANLILILFLLKGKISGNGLLKLICFILIVYSSLTLIQKLAYPSSPIFSIGSAQEEINNYFNRYLSFENVASVATTLFVKSLYSLKLTSFEDAQSPNGLLTFATEQNSLYFIPSILIFGLMVIGFILKRKNFLNKIDVILSLTFVLLINFIEFYFYSITTTFLYTQNCLIYLIILLGIIFSKMSPKITLWVCVAFILWQCAINIPAISAVEKHARLGAIEHYHFGIWLLYAFLSTILIYVILKIISKLINKDLFEIEPEKKIFYCLSLFVIFILANALFLMLFSGRS